ncbi:C-type lectin protein [Biscogniauxia mediterranea]|nr:C-type lectin protein [Biscogniauxia mediterranea]
MPSVLVSPVPPKLPLSPSKLGKEAYKTPESSNADIIDIRQATVESNLKEEIRNLFHPQDGPRRLPTLLLYDEKGLQLFEEITYLEEYYLTNHEIQLLKLYATKIAEAIPSGSLVVELGSGNLRKVLFLLQALEDAGKKIDYYALDLSEQELSRTLAQLPAFEHIQCRGLLGTYDDGREWLQTPSILAKPKCILHLGSSIGNFHRDEAATFLKGFADILHPERDSLLIGVDSCTDPSKYKYARWTMLKPTGHELDKKGVTHKFILNGLRHANEVLGEETFVPGDWEVIGEYVYDSEGGRHQAFYSPVRDTVVMGETIRVQERVQIEQSLKYSKIGCRNLWNSAGMVEVDRWMTEDEDYALHLLIKPTMSFSLKSHEYAQSNIPSLKDWESLWFFWDIVTRQMLPNEGLLDKPIKLRNACIFYLGHIPAFLDIQLTKTTKAPPTHPSFFQPMFERGIDPDVDNPELCHKHSEIPDEWPHVEEILEYQERVRERLRECYAHGVEKISRDIRRAIWVGFEHEVMHIETLLYMMLQSDKTLPPPHTPTPDFQGLAREARSSRVDNEWFDIPEQDVILGLDDPEDVLDSNGHFGWDNEKPPRRVHVQSFQSKGRPITNEEYAQYMYDTKTTMLPASWAEEMQELSDESNGHVNGHPNGDEDGRKPLPSSFLKGKTVRTVYGLVPLEYALDWPIFASYDELAGCAAWMGGRIPTFEEARSIYAYVDIGKRKQIERTLGKTVPAVNAHLVNDGVEETPPSAPSQLVDGGYSTKDELFIDLTDANVGFRHWHPIAVTANGNRLAGQAEMGGVWEWTSSPLKKYDGFEPISLYPAYTADFFDDKHNIVLGGSWATLPRIAGRKTFVNWYQRNYPYPWAGARLVRDKK